MARPRAPLLGISAEHPEPHRIRQAVTRLTAGEIVVYPTDTIYGLAADVDLKSGIDKLYALRKLDRKKPLSLVCASLSEASRYAIIANECFRYMRRVLPGPYTFILRATKEVPKTGDVKRRAVGIRIPSHPVALALVQELGRPVLTTSAIVDEADESDFSDPRALADHYSTGVALVLDAGMITGAPSSVVDWTEDDPKILRRGAGDVADLE